MSHNANQSPHRHSLSHDHTHGALDSALLTSQQGLRAIKWSFGGLLATAVVQVGIVFLTGSVALLADTIHNFADAVTAIPLWIAFSLVRRGPSRRFPYGYGRVEDLAGLVIVLMIVLSGFLSGYASLTRFFSPQPPDYLWAVGAASLIGFLGNEIVAVFRIRVGKEIGSAALVAEGYHARTDALTSLAVLIGAVGVWLGFPMADPLAGLVITVVIFQVAWASAKSVFTRLLDGIDPEVIGEVIHAAKYHVPEVLEVTEVRVRWLGHRLVAEVNVAVSSTFSVEKGHEIAKEVQHQLLHHLPYLSNATIHVDPANASGEDHHRVTEHAHDELPTHSH